MYMSPTEFEEIFESFRTKFPPAKSIKESNLTLTTSQINEMIVDFMPEVEWPRGGITRFMTAQGYKYEPVEVNDQIRFFWLISKDQESLMTTCLMAGN